MSLKMIGCYPEDFSIFHREETAFWACVPSDPAAGVVSARKAPFDWGYTSSKHVFLFEAAGMMTGSTSNCSQKVSFPPRKHQHSRDKLT